MADFESYKRRFGGFGDLFNATELARAKSPQADPELAALPPEQLVELNRYAQGGDVPATALLAAPYEAIKGVEQGTGIPVLTGASKVMNTLGVPVAPPKGNTSKASLGNVTASLKGAGQGLTEALLSAFRGRS